MKTHKGNMWNIYDKADYFVFTGNSFITNNGALVMGRGMAKQVLDKFPGIDILIGQLILKECGVRMRNYGFIHSGKIGVFQVKRHYTSKARIFLIRYSIKILCCFAKQHKSKQIHMNYPGIGYGRLTKKEVYPIIKQLPDNVHIWTR